MIEAFRDRYDRVLLQGWGMTETSPVCALARPPKEAPVEEAMDWQTKTGRVVPGVEVRIVDSDGQLLPEDGTAEGELEVRGPWVTGSYLGGVDADRFHDGWLRTGDVGSVDRLGYIQISDRVKDMVKSGGEWISSIRLENEVMAHPDVREAAVVGVADPRWGERPVVFVVAAAGRHPSPEDLREFLTDRVPHWWLPEQWVMVDELPKTSVGKFDKMALRSRLSAPS
jgi:fatty-acyl-CoA synthase